MFGQRFDIYQPGIHVLLQVPKGAKPSHTWLRVEADARRQGAACTDLYFKACNITGRWVKTGAVRGGLLFSASPQQSQPLVGKWLRFRKVELKIIRGRTRTGVHYLNIFVRHLSKVGTTRVGGLLGTDDHRRAATQSARCTRVVSLLDVGQGSDRIWPEQREAGGPAADASLL